MEVLLLAVVRFANGDVAALDFGRPVEPTLSTEAHIAAILEDFDRRKSELLDIGFSRAVPVLVQMLALPRKEPGAVLPLIKALGYLGRPQGAEAVARHVDDPDREVRLAAIRSLGQMGKFESIPVVARFLNSGDRAERREAIIALGKYAKPELIADVEGAAAGDVELMRLAGEAKQRVDATVTAIRTNDFHEFVDALIDTDEYEDILPLFMVAWRPVLQIVADNSRGPSTRLRALRLAWAARARRASEHLHDILDDLSQPPEMRLLAVETMGRIRARSAVERLLALMQSGEPGMLETSIEALGRIGDARALVPLLEMWDREGSALRGRLRLAISRLGTGSGVDALLDPLKTYQPREVIEVVFITAFDAVLRGYRREFIEMQLVTAEVEARRHATLLLASFGGKADFDTLVQMAETDSDPLVQQIAALGAERLKDIPIWERP